MAVPIQAHSFTPKLIKWVPNVFPLFLNGQYAQINYNSNGDPTKSNIFCGLLKTIDGMRNGEWNRWEEMSRAGLLVKRTKAFNAEAATNITNKHVLRPIPQTFIDGLTQDNGEPLTDSQKKALQNTGW